MNNKYAILIFQGKEIRVAWDAKQEKYFFAVSDIVQALTDSKNPRDYIKKMLQQDSELKSQWGTICTTIEMSTSNGKPSKIRVADQKGVFSIIDYIFSEKKESFYQWLVEVGNQQISWMSNTEKASVFSSALKSFFKHLPYYTLVAIVPLIVLIYQDNSSYNRFDNTDDFTSLYNNDTTLLVEDSTVLFLDSNYSVPAHSCLGGSKRNSPKQYTFR